MAVELIGTVINQADVITGFNVGNISTDDDFVQGVAAIGLKLSATTEEIYTTTIAGGPYNYSGPSARLGEHIIMWFNTKSRLTATTGFRIVVGDGTSRGHWNVVPVGFYKGGFITRVISTQLPFDSIADGTWTSGSNPQQLTAVTQVGCVHQTPSTLMGNFNNVQLDQFTTGFGVRVNEGTAGSPNTWETVRAHDEDTTFWGWWSSSQGAIVGKGKLYIGPFSGPVSGSNTSVFSDTAFTVVFANEKVSPTFYEINARGAGTTISWSLGSISAASRTVAPWRLTIDPSTNSFTDTNGVWNGCSGAVLHSGSTLVGTTILGSKRLVQNGATLNGITVINADTAPNVAFLRSNDLGKISNSSFAFSAGHAIEILASGSYNFSQNQFDGYGVSGSSGAAIYNNSGGAVTINILNGGSTPTIRNGAGASTTVLNTVPIVVNVVDTLNSPIADARVGIFNDSDDSVIINTLTNASGSVSDSFNYVSDTSIYVRIRKNSPGSGSRYVNIDTSGTIQASGFSAKITMRLDNIVS